MFEKEFNFLPKEYLAMLNQQNDYAGSHGMAGTYVMVAASHSLTILEGESSHWQPAVSAKHAV